MSKLYTQASGDLSKTNGTRRGSKEVSASVQSYAGSVIVRMEYKDETPVVRLEISKDDSSFYGREIFKGTIEDLEKLLTPCKLYK